MLTAGWCGIAITSPVGTALAGVSAGIHDALRARVLVLEQEGGEGLSFFAGAWQEPVLLRLDFAFEQATRARKPLAFSDHVELGI